MIDCREAYANGYRHGLHGWSRESPYSVRRSAYYMSESEWAEYTMRARVGRMMSQAFANGYRAGERARMILAAMGGETAFQRAYRRSFRGRQTRAA